MSGDWLIVGNKGLAVKYYPAVDLPDQPGAFNVSMDIRHGPQTVQGQVSSNNEVTIDMTPTETLHGMF